MIAAVHVTGTLINAGTVLLGTAVGTVLGDRLPERIRRTVMDGLGLFVLVVGVDEALAAFRPPLSTFTRASVVIVLLSVLVGGVLGELARIDDGLNRAGEALKRTLCRGQSRFTEGFVVASLVFCVGPLTSSAPSTTASGAITGCSPSRQRSTVLPRWRSRRRSGGVGFSIITILLYQGSLSLAASAVASGFSPEMIAALTAAGGVLILGIGLRLLELREIRVANLLPALIIAPATVAVMQAVR